MEIQCNNMVVQGSCGNIISPNTMHVIERKAIQSLQVDSSGCRCWHCKVRVAGDLEACKPRQSVDGGEVRRNNLPHVVQVRIGFCEGAYRHLLTESSRNLGMNYVFHIRSRLRVSYPYNQSIPIEPDFHHKAAHITYSLVICANRFEEPFRNAPDLSVKARTCSILETR